MIKDIEDKEINMVIVKDLSRFGRLSSQISYYLEEYFIEKGVRFIAVNDDIDTGNAESSEEITQFKAFFNEWFLRDTSKKIRYDASSEYGVQIISDKNITDVTLGGSDWATGRDSYNNVIATLNIEAENI